MRSTLICVPIVVLTTGVPAFAEKNPNALAPELVARCVVDPEAPTDTEIRNLALLAENSTFAKYDKNCNSVIDAIELEAMNLDLGKVNKSVKERIGVLKAARARSETIPLAEPPKESDGETDVVPQRLFIGRDKLDTRISQFDASNAAALSERGTPFNAGNGGALSFTSDQQSNTDTVSVDAVITYALFDDEVSDGDPLSALGISAYSFAPFADVQGDVKSNEQDVSRLEFGIDAQFEFPSNDLFDLQYFTFSPSFQTDLEGRARIYGAEIAWTPFRTGWSLGNGFTQQDRITDYFLWGLTLDANYRFVDDPGDTGLDDRNYGWLGASGTISIFPLKDILTDRLSLNLAGEARWDAVNSEAATLFRGGLGFTLTDDDRVTLNANYEAGRRYLTLEDIEQYKLELQFKY